MLIRLFQAGLFSAIVTAFIIDSYKRLQPDSGDNTVILLTQISHQLAALQNGSLSNISMPSTTSTSFEPPTSMLCVNALWFLSLVFSLSCALFATLVEQWARLYSLAIQRRPAPHQRARIRSYLYEGLLAYGMSTVVKGIPTLLHISLFLFAAGLVVFLFSINTIVAYVALSMFLTFLVFYLVATSLPIVSGNCPYQTPLSGSLWHISRWLHLLPYRDLGVSHMGSMTEARQKLALVYQPGREERDTRALRWTLESLTDEVELEPFIEGIPGFLVSKSAMNSLGATAITHLLDDRAVGLADRINSLLKTCENSRALVPYSRQRRAVSCLNTIWSLTTQSFLIDAGISGDWDSWCKQNPSHIVRNFLHDADPVVANHAYYAMLVLILQLLRKFAVLPQISDDDMDRLQRFMASGDSSSTAELSARLLHQLHTTHVKGMEVLKLVDCLVCTQTKVVHDALRRVLQPVVKDAELELWRLIPRRPGLPSIAILSSLSALTSVATPTISREGKPDLTSAKESLRQLHQLRYAFEEARFELIARYLSHLSVDTFLPDKVIDTLRQAMAGLPDRPAHRLMQISIVESLRDLIQRDDSQINHGTMEPVIDMVLDIARRLSDAEAIQAAKEAILIYKRTSRHNKAANDALVSLRSVLADKDIPQPSTSAIVTPYSVGPPNEPPTVDSGFSSRIAASSSTMPSRHPRDTPSTPA